MRKKRYKLMMLERNRYSVFFDSLAMCCNCGSMYGITKHEIYEGRNRQNSMRYGFVLPLCGWCHSILQEDIDFNKKWKVKAQTYFEKNYGTRDDFIKIFRMNYKEKD